MPTTIRRIAGQSKAEAKNDHDYQRDAFACKWMHMMRSHPIFPPFFPPFFPLFPLQPLLPPIIPLTPPQTNKLFEAPTPKWRNGATTATTGNNNRMFCKGSFLLQPSISKNQTVSQQSRPSPASAVRLLLAEYRQTVYLTYTLRHPLSSGAPRRPGGLQRQQHLACIGQQHLTCHPLRLFHMKN